MEEFWEIAIPLIALFGSIIIAVFLLVRVRSHAKPETPENGVQLPASASRRQRRVLETLSTEPEIPTLMDLVNQEISELGVDQVAGFEQLSGPVALKVFRRDALTRQRCEHDALEFVVADGTDPAEAEEDDVTLFCPQCGEPGTNEDG